jgi:predicted HicB family RNase H-like nuclease
MIGLMLRLPDDLHKALKELAQKDNRSLNSEMIHILKQYIEQALKEKEKP